MEGTPFGRYRLVEVLARGGMGEVWRAFDTITERTVAVKVLPAHLAADREFQQRFLREAKAVAGLDEPHVVPIYDFGEIDGRLFVSMRLVDGPDLQTLLSRGPLPPDRAVAIVEQVAAALQAAHNVGLVHRDVKPSNILIGDDDFAYLIDFGLARATGETALTSTGMTLGTWPYMAPERFRTGTADARSDVYALTCVLHQALTGQQPFPGEALEQIAASHMFDPPPRPSAIRPSVPTAMDDVITSGMAKDPAQRYATTKDLARAARAALPAPAQEPGHENSDTASATTQLASEPPTQAAPTVYAANAPTQQAPVDGAGPASVRRSDASLPAPADPTPAQPMRRRRTMILAAAAVTVALVIGLVIFVAVNQHVKVLQFTDLREPHAVAVDRDGAVYVADMLNDRVLRLAAGSSTQTVLPFTGLHGPRGVAVDGDGAVYVADTANRRVLKLAAGSNAQTVLPFTGLGGPHGLAADGGGAVYVADADNGRVLKLPAGSSTQTVLPFTDLEEPRGLAVDSDGAVYVTDIGSNRVLKLAAGSSTPTELPFDDLAEPRGVAVDGAGAVYVVNNEHSAPRVLKSAAGSDERAVVPATWPTGVAVGSDGAVYVTDTGDNRVLKVAARCIDDVSTHPGTSWSCKYALPSFL